MLPSRFDVARHVAPIIERFCFAYADAMDGIRHGAVTRERYVERVLAIDVVRE